MKTRMKLLLGLAFLGFLDLSAQIDPNYDERKVPAYQLPSILMDGKINKVKKWEKQRTKWLESLEEEMYGYFPDKGIRVSFELVQVKERILDGQASMREVDLIFNSGKSEHRVRMLIFLPSKLPLEGAPLFLGLNFYGNHTIHPLPDISISKSWVANNADFNIESNQADERSRGVRVSRWPVKRIIEEGYGLATIYAGDIDPDFDDGFKNGIHSLLKNPDYNELSTLSAWAWGLSKAMDYFETDATIDQTKVFIIGHSRMGKATLWAGAKDERFAMVISNDSGCGGAALSRRKFGETVAVINEVFPHWFCNAFNVYSDHEEQLPFDQHTLLAMIAPRPLYVASAEEDQWADPKGEFLAAKEACKVYQLYGESCQLDVMPPVQNPVFQSKVGYHIRTGKHDLTEYDWEQYLQFAALHF